MKANRIAFLRVIFEYYARNGFAPTYAEIAEKVGVSSVGTVSWAMKAMERRGWIHRYRGMPRTVTVTPAGVKALESE